MGELVADITDYLPCSEDKVALDVVAVHFKGEQDGRSGTSYSKRGTRDSVLNFDPTDTAVSSHKVILVSRV